MKRKVTRSFAILLTIILVCLLFAGCNRVSDFTEEDYKSLEMFVVDGATDASGVSAGNYALWGAKSPLLNSEKKPPKTIEVEFEGKTYAGTFESSVVNAYENYRTDVYNNAEVGSFYVNGETGALTYIYFDQQKSKQVVSDEKRDEIAFELAQKYIDTNKYRLSTSENGTIRHYQFSKFISDTEFFEEWLRISVSEYGQVTSFKSSMLGVYPDRIQDLPTQEQERIRLLRSTAAKEKAVALVKESVKDNKDVTFSVTDVTQFVLLENNTWGLIYGIVFDSPPKEVEPGVYVDWGSNETVRVLVK